MNGNMTMKMCATAAVMVATVSIGHGSELRQVTPLATVIVDTQVNSFNRAAWDQDKLVSYGDYQYMLYWDADRSLVVARRDMRDNSVQRVTLPYYLSINNGHRSTPVGISPEDGRLHLAWDHHNNDFNYTKSIAGFLTNPPEVMTLEHFEAKQPIAFDAPQQVTYPRFINDRDGNLTLIYRNRGSGQGASIIASYNPNNPVVMTPLSAGFEAPNYTAGQSLIGQNDWINTSGSSANMTVITPTGSQPASPQGSQYARIAKPAGQSSVRATRALLSSHGEITDAFTINALMAYADATLDGTFLGMYVDDLNPTADASSYGVTFGFKEIGGQMHLSYREGNDWQSLGLAAENTFYRFIVDVAPQPTRLGSYVGDPTTYSIAVQDTLGNPIASAANVNIRQPNDYVIDRFRRVQLAVGTGNAGTLYVDDLSVTTSASYSMHWELPPVPLFDPSGTYSPFFDSDSRNAYEHDVLFDENNRMHITWVYRETAPTWATNHDLHYAYSDDGGITWMNNDGVQVADLANGDSININDPGLVVYAIPVYNWLMNQGAMTLDSKNQPHVATYHLPEGMTWGDEGVTDPSEVPSNPPPEIREQIRYHHYWRDEDGNWHSSGALELPEGITITRPAMVMDADDNAILYWSVAGLGFVAYVSTAESEWTDWELVQLTGPEYRYSDATKHDRNLLLEHGILSFTANYQNPDGTGFAIIDINIADIIPEPASLTLLGLGGAMLLKRRREV